MSTIHVNAGKGYDVRIEEGLLRDAAAIIKEVCPGAKKLAIISDSKVYPLYGASICEGLASAGFDVKAYVFPSGEEHKNISTYAGILEFLAEWRLSRGDCIAALGGGVCGDIAGFAAATFLRGVAYVQIPTTLLACVDSSVGGKTAIDLAAGKNLAGAFYQPAAVLIDPAVLNTLPAEVYKDGCAEVIKYGVLGNRDFFFQLREKPIDQQASYVIETCVGMKKQIVEADEFDRGERQKLNLGHTFGHAIEKLSNYGISHGHAVAAGLGIMARAAAVKGYCPREDALEIISLLDRYGLPQTCQFTASEVAQAALSDKKAGAGTINLIVPRRIGECDIVKTDLADLMDWLDAGGL